jgi:hypothetical protein
MADCRSHPAMLSLFLIVSVFLSGAKDLLFSRLKTKAGSSPGAPQFTSRNTPTPQLLSLFLID